MKLPSHLASRYSKMTDQEMGGDAAAAQLLKAGMLKSGGRPGPIAIPDAKITKAILRPGVIQWNDKTDTGVSFNIGKAGGKQITSASHLNLDKLLHSRYVQQSVQQGRDVRDFTGPVVSSAKAEAKAAVKAAAKVEAKATALAAKAKATKEKALAGLGYFGAADDEDVALTPEQQKEMDVMVAAGSKAAMKSIMIKKIVIVAAVLIVGALVAKNAGLF